MNTGLQYVKESKERKWHYEPTTHACYQEWFHDRPKSDSKKCACVDSNRFDQESECVIFEFASPNEGSSMQIYFLADIITSLSYFKKKSIEIRTPSSTVKLQVRSNLNSSERPRLSNLSCPHCNAHVITLGFRNGGPPCSNVSVIQRCTHDEVGSRPVGKIIASRPKTRS